MTRTRTGAESRTQPTMESRDGHRLRRCDRGTADRSPRRDCRDGCEQPPWLGSGRGIAVPRAFQPRALLQRLRSIYVACTDRNPDGVPRSDSTAGCRGPARKRSVYLPSAARVRVEIGARCAASGRCRGQPQQPRAHSRCGNPVPGMGRRAGRGTAIEGAAARVCARRAQTGPLTGRRSGGAPRSASQTDSDCRNPSS